MTIFQDDTAMAAIATLRNRGYSSDDVCRALAHAQAQVDQPLPILVSESKFRAGHEREGAYLRAVHASSDARPWREEATDMTDGLGLQILDLNGGTHVQFVQDGKVLANWYPSKGTTVMGNLRGPRCITGEDVVTWLKGL